MGQSESSLSAGRRIIAVGAWVLPVLMMGSVPSEISMGTAISLLALLSISSAISLLLISEDWRSGSKQPGWIRSVSVGTSLAIPFGWAIWLGAQSSLQISPLLSILSIFPPLVACQVMGRKTESILPSHLFAIKESPFTGKPSLTQPVITEPSLDSEEIDRVQLGLVSMQDPPIAADVTQWLTRSLTPDGETIEGAVRVEFQNGQRDAIVHLSFCPPAICIPEIVTEDLDGADLEIRVAASFKFGARLTIRRQTSSHSKGEKLLAATFQIGFVAVASNMQRIA